MALTKVAALPFVVIVIAIVAITVLPICLYFPVALTEVNVPVCAVIVGVKVVHAVNAVWKELESVIAPLAASVASPEMVFQSGDLPVLPIIS